MSQLLKLTSRLSHWIQNDDFSEQTDEWTSEAGKTTLSEDIKDNSLVHADQ